MATERVGILIETVGYEKAMAQMQQIERAVSTFRGKNARIQLDDGRIVTVNQRIKELRRNIEALKSEKVKIMSDGGSKERIAQINKELRESRAELSRLQTASSKAGASLTQTFNSISSKVAHLGSAMQSLGNAFGKLWSPFRTLFRGTIFAAGYKLLNMLTTGISGAAQRYDVFKTYANTLKALGYEAEGLITIGGKTGNALDLMEDSVLGLPTALDDIVASQKKYLAASGDMTKATMAAIAANNIFLAQGSDQKDQLRGARQIRNLLAGGTMTGQRWQSILESMPLAVNAVGLELGYADNELDQFRKDLVDGKIDAQDFLDALLKVGTSGKIREAVEQQKHTFGAVTANITTAFRRMGEGVLKTMDEILMRTTGKDTIDWLLSFKGVIDKFSQGFQNWLRAHPELLTNFIKELKNIDWNALLTGIGEGLVWSLERLYDALHLFEKLDLKGFGKLLGASGFLSFFFTTGGGLLKGSRHIFAAIGTGFSLLAQGLITMGGFRVLGGVENLAALSRVGKTVSIGGTLKSVAASLAPMLKLAGGIVIGGIAGMAAIKSMKVMIKDFAEIAHLISETDWSGAKAGAAAIAGFFGVFIGLSEAAGHALMANPEAVGVFGAGAVIVGALTTFISGVAALDMSMLKSAVKSLAVITKDMQTVIDNVNALKMKPVNEEAIVSALSTLNRIYDYMKPQYQGEGIQNLSSGTAEKMAATVKSLAGIIKTLNDVTDDLNEMSTLDNADAVQANVDSLLDTLDAMYSRIREYYEPKDTGHSDNYKATIANIVAMATSLKESVAILNEIGGAEMDLEKARANIEGIVHLLVGDGNKPGLFQSLQTLFSSYEIGASEYSVGRTGVSGTVVSDSQNLVELFNNLSSVIAAVRSAYDGIMGEEGFEWSPGKILSKIEDIREIATYLGELWNGSNGVVGLGTMTSDFSDASNFSANLASIVAALQSMRDAVNQINELAGMDVKTDLSNITSGLEALKPQMESIKSSLKSLGEAFTEGFIESFNFDGVVTALTSGLDGVVSATDGYKDKMRAKGAEIGKAFVSGLKNQMTTINVSTTVNVNAKLGSLSGVGAIREAIRGAVGRGISAVATVGGRVVKSRGGYIYRAGGGGVPRGTDTVPAMLTPGEFVTRRRAVKAFGKDFMQRVNSLDVDGAMRALNARFGNQISNSSTSTVNNVINNNNNQRVTQNITTNSEKFAFRRASRFAGAI